MGKNKLHRWAEMENYEHVVQPSFEEVFRKDYKLKGKWRKEFFKNSNPIILELGCGKGEYTIGMAEQYPMHNFLGVDIKGARIWKGAKEAYERGLKNVGFLRTRIELIDSFFAPNEIDEIWITFPDPQIRKRRNKKRLTGSRFLLTYAAFLNKNGKIHLKTDSAELYEYTSALLKYNNIIPELSTPDLYSGKIDNALLHIKTHYEQLFLNEGKKITYTRFLIPFGQKLVELPENND